MKIKYWVNTTADEVKLWTVTNSATVGTFGSYTTSSTANYGAGELYKTVSEDEQGKQVVEFKDKEGRVVLKKVQLTASKEEGTGSGHGGWLCTYYLYDDLGQLRCVVQPRGVELMDPATTPGATWTLSQTLLEEQCFRYEYDERGRMIVKKVPGAAPVYMVYDPRDRLVLTQDGNQRPRGQWLYTKYDALNRPVMTGIYTYWGTHQEAMDLAKNYFPFAYEEEDPSNATTGYTSRCWPEVNLEVLSVTHYDNYNNVPAPLSASLIYSYINPTNFNTAYNVSPDYAQEIKQSNAVKGLVTWTKTRVLGASQFLSAVNLYDDKGRLIQVHAINQTAGYDIVTNQYDFSGKVIRTHQRIQQYSPSVTRNYELATKNTYDELGRLIQVEKNLNNTGWKTLSTLQYDALGQVKTKMLGTKAGSSAPLAKCDYQYNIRGWLLSINKDYMGSAANQDQYFSLELGYDKSASLGTFAPQYNGNIAGVVWKSAGDEEKRKYDFSYDAVNRLTGADFTQWVSGSGSTAVFDRSAGVDFSVSNLSYDQNGNILTMNQMGLKLNSSSPIDQLTYGYYPNTNKLAKVSDGITGPSKLGDFVDGTNQWDDYGYDVNGNMVTDLNKGMGTATGVDQTSGGGISYNYLNLPEVITTPKGIITYSYDAAGNKLKKVVAESGQPAKTTLYLSGAVYEDDQLQFLAHEEGRIRTRTPNRLDTLYYDYFIKDHLGNVRMVLTDEQKQDMYPAATMESASASTEEALYSNMTNTRVDKPEGYPYDPYLDPNYKVAKVRGDGQKVGPGILLKVMAGDRFNLRASSWYKLNGTTPSVPNTVLQDLVFMLNWGAARVPGSKETQQTLENSGVFQPGAGRFLTEHTDSYIPSRPKAYVNWVLFDEQFKYVGSCSGAEQVGEDGVLTPHVHNDLPVEKNGYLYVYVSNETPNIDVFFDNVQVTHIRGALLEETHYYPFGLTMAGISSRAAGGLENRKKFNDGTELENQEFSDGSGLELYATEFRSYDPQIGRFHQIDELADYFEGWSPYVFAYNNPILFNDPLGLSASDSTVKPSPPPPPETSTAENPKVLPEVVVVGQPKPKPPAIPTQSLTPQPIVIPYGKGQPISDNNISLAKVGITALRINPEIALPVVGAIAGGVTVYGVIMYHNTSANYSPTQYWGSAMDNTYHVFQPIYMPNTQLLQLPAMLLTKGGRKNLWDDKVSPLSNEALQKLYEEAKRNNDKQLKKKIETEQKRRGDRNKQKRQ